MKGRINKAGLLIIERAGKEKVQCCPYDATGCECGDWCPMFNEPEYFSDDVVFGDDGGGVQLSICENIFTFKKGEFTDERGQS